MCAGAIGEAGEGRGMGAPGLGAGFDQVKTKPVVQSGMPLARRAEDIGGEPAVARAGFDEIEESARTRRAMSRIENLGHLGDLLFEQVAEQRPDVDAGKKIARASRPLGRAGVVAELGIVKREIHERGHRHRAAFTNHIFNRQSSICNPSIVNAPILFIPS